jgi:hypothetical protein
MAATMPETLSTQKNLSPKHMRGAAVGPLALLRNEGGSFGTSMVQTLQEWRNQFHTARVASSSWLISER